MATIAFFIPPAAGAMHASYKLAKVLTADGNVVCYVGPPDCEGYVLGNGFEFKAIFAKWFPKGFFAAARTQAPETIFGRFSNIRRRTAYLQQVFDALRNEGLYEYRSLMRDLRPDLCLIGSAYLESTIWALLAHDSRLRCAYLNSTLIYSADRTVPPMCTRIVPNGSRVSGLQIRLAWWVLLRKKRIAEFARSMLRLDLDWPKQFARLAEACGYPARLLKFDHPVSPRLHFPELVLWKREFDFPRADAPNRFYIGPLIDDSRPQAPFPWERIRAGRKLIYCALGSLPFLTARQYCVFYQSVVDAASMRPQWEWIIATGEGVNAAGLKAIPENALILQWAPQLAILERTHIAITHGGANSVKECICYGVPMLMYPLGLDHPGNAARAAFHGVGAIGDPRRVSAGQIVCLLDRIDQTPGFRARAARLREQFASGDPSAAARQAVKAIAQTS